MDAVLTNRQCRNRKEKDEISRANENYKVKKIKITNFGGSNKIKRKFRDMDRTIGGHEAGKYDFIESERNVYEALKEDFDLI